MNLKKISIRFFCMVIVFSILHILGYLGTGPNLLATDTVETEEIIGRTGGLSGIGKIIDKMKDNIKDTMPWLIFGITEDQLSEIIEFMKKQPNLITMDDIDLTSIPNGISVSNIPPWILIENLEMIGDISKDEYIMLINLRLIKKFQYDYRKNPDIIDEINFVGTPQYIMDIVSKIVNANPGSGNDPTIIQDSSSGGDAQSFESVGMGVENVAKNSYLTIITPFIIIIIFIGVVKKLFHFTG